MPQYDTCSQWRRHADTDRAPCLPILNTGAPRAPLRNIIDLLSMLKGGPHVHAVFSTVDVGGAAGTLAPRHPRNAGRRRALGPGAWGRAFPLRRGLGAHHY